MNPKDFARLKHEVETRQVNVDKAFAKLDDLARRHEEKGGSSNEVEEKVVLLERLMEAMSRLNATYRDYVQALEKELGF